MLFRPDMVEKILAGEKTQTRRVWKKAHVKVGNTYAIKKHYYQKNVDAPGFIRITGLRVEPLIEITNMDAKKEGFQSLREFVDVWTELHGEPEWHNDVWVIDFELVDGGKE